MIGGGTASLFNYLYQLSMGRMLGPEKYAVLGSLFAILYIIQMSFGSITTVLSKFSSHLSATDQNEKLSYLARETFKVMFIIGIVLFIFLLALTPIIEKFLKISDFIGIIIVATIGVLGLFGSTISGMLNGLQKFISQNLISSTSAIIKFSLAIFLVILGYEVDGALIAVLLAGIYGLILGLIFLRKVISHKKIKKFSLKPVIRYFIPVFTANILFALMITVDQILVKHLFTSKEAGYYIAASNVAKIVWFGSGFFIGAMFPMVSANFAKNKNTTKLLKKTITYTAILGLTGVITYFLFPKLIVNILYGKQYNISSLIGPFGLSMVFYTLNLVFASYNLAIHKYKFIFAYLTAVLAEAFLILIFHSTILRVVEICLSVNAGLLLYFLITNIIKKNQKWTLKRSSQ